MDGRDVGTATGSRPLRLRPGRTLPVLVRITATGAWPVKVRDVKIEGGVLGLACFTYETQGDLSAVPGTPDERRYDMHLIDLQGGDRAAAGPGGPLRRPGQHRRHPHLRGGGPGQRAVGLPHVRAGRYTLTATCGGRSASARLDLVVQSSSTGTSGSAATTTASVLTFFVLLGGQLLRPSAAAVLNTPTT